MGDHEAKDDSKSYFSSGLYDSLKFLAQIVLPALGTLYFALAGIWGLPSATQVIGSITAVDAFLGVVLGISSSSYEKSGAKYDGSMVVKNDPDEGKQVVSFVTNTEDPRDILGKKEVTFKVHQSN